MVKRRVVTFLEERDIERLDKTSTKLYGKKSRYRILADLALKGLHDIEQGRGVQETHSGTGEADAKHGGGTEKERDWKREYEEYRRRYGGT